MDNLSPRWRKWVQNLGWFLVTVVVLGGLMIFTRNFVILVALWAVALIWGTILTLQIVRLIFRSTEITVGEAELQTYLQQSRTYQEQINQAINKSDNKSARVHLDTLATRIEVWTTSIEKLVQRLDTIRRDDVIRQDLRRVPKAIADLEKRLGHETDQVIQAQLERTLDNRRKQRQALDDLQRVMKQAEIQIESTLSRLGTIYSQILTGQSSDDVADYRRFSTDVDEEVRQLEDYLDALQEVKLGQDES